MRRQSTVRVWETVTRVLGIYKYPLRNVKLILLKRYKRREELRNSRLLYRISIYVRISGGLTNCVSPKSDLKTYLLTHLPTSMQGFSVLSFDVERLYTNYTLNQTLISSSDLKRDIKLMFMRRLRTYNNLKTRPFDRRSQSTKALIKSGVFMKLLQ